MKRKRYLLTVAAAIITPVLLATLFMWSQGASLRAWRLLGQRKISIIKNADKVEVYRIKWRGRSGLHDYTVIGKSKVQSPAFTSRAKTTIVNVFNTKPYIKLGGADCEFT